MDYIETIAQALDQHADAERRISRFEEDLAAHLQKSVADELSELVFVSDALRTRIEMVTFSLARDTVDGLPDLISATAKGASVSRTAFASALNPEMLTFVSAPIMKALRTTVMSSILAAEKSKVAAQMEQDRLAPLDIAGPSKGLDLGAFAKEQSLRNNIEDAKSAAPPPPRGSFIGDDPLVAIERTAAQGKYPAKKGKR